MSSKVGLAAQPKIPEEESVVMVERIYKDIGAAIRTSRRAAGLSQRELAKKAKLSRPHLANMERGEQRIWPHHLDKISKVLKVQIWI